MFLSDIETFIQHPVTDCLSSLGAEFLFDNNRPGVVIVSCPPLLRKAVEFNLPGVLPKHMKMEFAKDA